MNSSSNSSLNSTWIPDGVVSGRLIWSIIMGLCCVLGLPGNIGVLVVILRRSSRLLNFTLCLMLNLASSNILCLAMVLYPQMWNRLGRKGEVVLLLALWGLACALTAPTVVTRDVVDGELKCQRHTGSDAERVAVLVSETVLWFVVPFSVLVTSYCRLHRRVNQTALFSSAKMTWLVTSVVVAFFILLIPVHIVNMVDITCIVQHTPLTELSVALRCHRNAVASVARCFMVINSCLDHFLYAFALRRIREQPKSS
ncbi:apelin receptor A-like [Oncorhynchus masou masou]|uniref:apelin receptor A-like n=1 Tax=Oncorhynchus masou masou TaxID=90313 RepID=UPI0031842EDA